MHRELYAVIIRNKKSPKSHKYLAKKENAAISGSILRKKDVKFVEDLIFSSIRSGRRHRWRGSGD